MSSGRRCIEPRGDVGARTSPLALSSAVFFITLSTSDSLGFAGVSGLDCVSFDLDLDLGLLISVDPVAARGTFLHVNVDGPRFRGSGGIGGGLPALTFAQYPWIGVGTSSAKHAFRMS